MSDYLGGNIKQHFNYLLESGNETAARQFLDHQNISDVADLINEFPEQEGYIITHMSIHRAASVFKILDLSAQKHIIRELPPFKTRNFKVLSPDDRTDFLEELPSNAVRELIKLLDPEERKTPFIIGLSGR
jgi:Mg/Co/Ni transporter MgtE (contains CBS domain)